VATSSLFEISQQEQRKAAAEPLQLEREDTDMSQVTISVDSFKQQ
jgi:hypothetical protein